MHTKTLLVAAGLAAALNGHARAEQPTAAPATIPGDTAAVGFSPRWFDRSVDPCTDLYQFACGTWMKEYPVPADRAAFNRFSELADRNELIVKGILERTAAATSTRSVGEQQVGDFYAACMDEGAVDARGMTPIADQFARLGKIPDRAGLIHAQAELVSNGIGGFTGLGATPDPRDSSQVIAQVGEGTFGLPDRDLYLEDDERSVKLRTAYREHIARMFALAGQSDGQAAVEQVMQIETALAKATMDRVRIRDPKVRDNPMTVKELSAAGPDVGYAAFFKELEAPSFDRLNVVNPQYVKDLNAALTTLPIEAWRRYLQWRLLSESAGLLSKPFVDENFRFFGQTLSGQKELRPRWKRCTTLVAGQLNDFSLGELIGVEFAKEHFGPDARARMAELIAGLERALAQDIKDIDWMGAETKQRALVKLKAFSKKIGAPDRIRDYSAVKTSRGDLVASRRSVDADAFHYELSQIGKPLDRTEWGMTAQEVNAYYAAPLNEIAFPAGILQPPYFDVTKDDAVNYGAIGAVIGHELTHGFDDEGRKYDAQGNLTDWWTAEDDSRFRERADCVSKQYSGFTAIGDMKLRGDLELGENVADNGGVRIAYMALLEQLVKRPAPEKIDGYTPHQRFFLGWAQSWCENNTDELLRRRVQEDVHSPGRFRVIGVVQNSPEFRKAFGCAPPQPMAPENMCRVW